MRYGVRGFSCARIGRVFHTHSSRRWPWVTSTLVFGLIAVVLGVLAFVQWGQLRERGMRANWGSVPDWVAGVGTVLAFAIATAVFAYEVWERRRSERRRQAEQITAWIGPGLQSRYREWIRGHGLDILVHAHVNLINASDSVIYDLFVVVTCEHSDIPLPMVMDSGDLVQSEPTEWEHHRDRHARGRASTLPPGQWTVSVRLSNTSVRPLRLDLFFRDHRGIYWRRDPMGQLHEQPHVPLEERSGGVRLQLIEDALGEGTMSSNVGTLVPKPLRPEEST